MPDDDPLLKPAIPPDRLSRLELEDRWRASHRHNVFTDLLLVLIVAGLAAAAWYAYPIFKKHQAGIAQLPDLRNSLGTVQDQLESAANKLDGWVSDQQTLRDRTDRALRDLRARVDAVQTQTGEGAAAMMERLRSEIGPEIDRVQTRLAELGTSRAADQERIASLEQELKEIRERAGQQDQELAGMRQKVDEQDALAQRQIAELGDLKQTEGINRRDFDLLNDKLAIERVDFEATKNRNTDIAPGITLSVTGIDVAFGRITGSIWVLPDRRTIWMRGQGAQQPVEFYSTADGRKRELLITHVTEDSVAGYLLLPKVAGVSTISPAAE